MELYLQGILIALKGAPATIGVSLFAVVIGAAVGLGFALMKQSRNKLVRAIAKIYIEIVRGTPMIGSGPHNGFRASRICCSRTEYRLNGLNS